MQRLAGLPIKRYSLQQIQAFAWERGSITAGESVN